MSMTSVLVIGAFPEDISVIKGGVEASVIGLARSLRAHDDVRDVKVIALPTRSTQVRKAATVNGMEVLYLKGHRFLALNALHLPWILRYAQSHRPSVAHVHGTGLLQALLLTALRLQNARLVWTLHGITAKETLQRYNADKKFSSLARHLFYRWLEWFSLAAAPRIIVDTPYVASEVGLRKNIHVIPQGIFAEEFSTPENGCPDNFLILSVGVISPRKGHHKTIAAFARVKESIPEATLIIAGVVSDARYHHRLERQIMEAGLSGSVKILTNAARSKLVALFTRAKVFALHSEEESQGIALCEALACGVPVVATKAGGIPYVVRDGKTGFLVEYGNIEGFADAIISLLSDAVLRAEMSRRAKISGSRFDWKNITDEVIRIYKS